MKKTITLIVLGIMLTMLILPAYASTTALPCDYCNGKYLRIRSEYYQDLRHEFKVENGVTYIRYIQEYRYYMICTNNHTTGHYMYSAERYTDWEAFGW